MLMVILDFWEVKITIIGHHLTRNKLEKGVSFERKVGATTEEEEEEWNKI